jgi:hypothetical protein
VYHYSDQLILMNRDQIRNQLNMSSWECESENVGTGQNLESSRNYTVIYFIEKSIRIFSNNCLNVNEDEQPDPYIHIIPLLKWNSFMRCLLTLLLDNCEKSLKKLDNFAMYMSYQSYNFDKKCNFGTTYIFNILTRKTKNQCASDDTGRSTR